MAVNLLKFNVSQLHCFIAFIK